MATHVNGGASGEDPAAFPGARATWTEERTSNSNPPSTCFAMAATLPSKRRGSEPAARRLSLTTSLPLIAERKETVARRATPSLPLSLSLDSRASSPRAPVLSHQHVVEEDNAWDTPSQQRLLIEFKSSSRPVPGTAVDGSLAQQPARRRYSSAFGLFW